MEIKIIIKKNAYYDSVTLMSLSGKITAMPDVLDAVVAMATDMNKELLRNVGMMNTEIASCEANDLIIAVKAESMEACRDTVTLAEELLSKRVSDKKNAAVQMPTTIQSAVKMVPMANLAVISIPGEYAAREAREALKRGLHVMLFSDNVTLEEEKDLKEFAHSQGLLVMGPDCGTAIINNAGLCFANNIRKGNIGIVGASGTGLQEVTVMIDRFGGGVTQVIGTGGRDLSEHIGGIMMLDALAALNRDEATEVIVMVSKPPAKPVADKVLAEVKKCAKPVVVCFINGDAGQVEATGASFGRTLEETAYKAVKLSRGERDVCLEYESEELIIMANAIKSKLNAEQRYVRGLFCGGTLCYEAMHIVKSKAGKVYSNIAKQTELKLADPHFSMEHTFIDLGDDAFTVGKPHPMIEPGLRLQRLIDEAHDLAVAVILLDIVIGYGSHADPAGIIVPAILEAKNMAKAEGRHLEVIAYVCGTDGDMQNRPEQERKLAEAGVILAASNARAARLAAAIVA